MRHNIFRNVVIFPFSAIIENTIANILCWNVFVKVSQKLKASQNKRKRNVETEKFNRIEMNETN